MVLTDPSLLPVAKDDPGWLLLATALLVALHAAEHGVGALIGGWW